MKFGVYTFGGHVNSLDTHSSGDIVVNEPTEGDLVISGSVMTGQEQLPMPPDTLTFPMDNPEGAEVHAAIAPHGQLDVSLLPGDLYNPAGNPACTCWWVAIFLPPA